MKALVKNGNKLRWKFDNIKNLPANGMFSDKFSLDGVDWKFHVYTTSNDIQWFGVFLNYDSDNKNERNWICEVDTKYKLLNQRGTGKDLVKKAINCFRQEQFSWGYLEFIEWHKIVSEEFGYMKNDSIVFEIEIDFKYYDFSKKIPNFTDIIVNVEETDFHVNRWVLSSKSEYFFDLFVNKKFTDPVIHLDDVKATELCYILASLNTFFDTVSKKNCAELIKIANQYGVSTLHLLCERFLIILTEIELIQRIKYAEDNGYEKLMKFCIESLKIGADIKSLQSNVKFPELKESTKMRIIQRLLDIY